MKLLASLLTAAIFAAPAFPAFSAGETPVKADAAKGQTSYGAVCAACHAADGNSTIPLQPKLAGQHPEYLVKQLREFKGWNGNPPVRENAIMGAMVAGLEEAADSLPESVPRRSSVGEAMAASASGRRRARNAGRRKLGSIGLTGWRAARTATRCGRCRPRKRPARPGSAALPPLRQWSAP
mgnify:CR=1 FL=1